MSSPRVLMISGDFPPFPGGVGDYADRLCASLSDGGAEVTLLTSTSDPDPADSTRNFAVLRTIDHWGMKNYRAVLDACCRGYDVVQIQYPCVSYGRSPLINLLPAMLRMHECAPSVLTIHDFRVMRRRWRARLIPSLCAVNGIVHVDKLDWPFIQSWGAGKNKPRAHIPIAPNTRVVPCNPTLRAQWRTELGFKPDETVVAFFGMLYPHKGLTELLGAVHDLRQQGRAVRLLVLGDFDRQADYRAPMEKMLEDPAVKWVQGAPLDKVSRGLHGADLAALPFHSGASTNRSSLLSALSHGLPSITTNGPCTPPDFDKMFDVLLVPVNDQPAIASALAQLMDDPELRDRMRQASLSKQISWDTVARETLAFYSQLIPTPSVSPA